MNKMLLFYVIIRWGPLGQGPEVLQVGSLADRWRWFFGSPGSARREGNKFVLRCVFTQAQIMLFVQFHWLTFT